MQVQKTIVFNVEFNSFEDTKKIRFLKKTQDREKIKKTNSSLT
jgi:hypothetical protein